MFKNKTILITGGTGSFGKRFIEMTLSKFKLKKIIIYSRDEMKQWDLQYKFSKFKNIQFIVGDVRDKSSLSNAMNGVDYVVHAAATKIVPTAEYNPFECIKTNVFGAMNIIEVCREHKIKKLIALSTDKASNPINLYGASKLASDKLFIAANSTYKNSTSFSIVRYGNVMGSRGSLIPYLMSIKDKKLFPITDIRMTRFMISLEKAVELVWHAFKDSLGGEIYVKKIPSMKIVDIARAIEPKSKFNIIGTRPGEKIHEQMIGVEDAMYTYEFKDYYKILPAINNLYKDKKRIGAGKIVLPDFEYKSNLNSHWMTKTELQKWIKLNDANLIFVNQ